MSEAARAPAQDEEAGLVVKLLSVFAVVHPHEVASVLLLTLDGILLLASYYFLKTIREPLILNAPVIDLGFARVGGAEIKAYSTAVLAVLLIGVFYAYREVARRVARLKLITYTKLFCIGCLLLFWSLGQAGVNIGIPFFLWVGCYSLTILAQFWAFANDIYNPEQGKRLFALVGVGASVGALIGSYLAKLAVKPFGLYNMMLVPAGVLLVCLAIIWTVNARETGKSEAQRKQAEAPPGGSGGMQMILKERYLLLIAAIILTLNLINSNGEFILDKTLEEAKAGLSTGEANVLVGEFKADYFFWANAAGVAIQVFLTSRIFKYLDIRGALFIYPLLALCSYTTMLFFPLLAVVKWGKITENSVDYSVYNSVKQALWLPTTREEKYVAKQAIDTFVVRAGDFVSGMFVAALSALNFGGTHFIILNIALGGVFVLVATLTRRQHAKRTAEAAAKKAAEPTTAAAA